MIWMIRLICQNMAAGKYEGEAYIYGHEEVIEMLETICKMLLQSKQIKYINDRLHLVVVNDGETKEIIGKKVTFFDIHSTKAKQFGYMMELDEKNRILRIPKFVYPGDKVSPSVSFYAPDKPGTYVMNWKMKDSKGKIVFPDKLGIGLHFMVMDFEEDKAIRGENYNVIEEIPRLSAPIIAGNLYSHTWIIQNTGMTIWNEYYLECINGDNFSYVKKELCVPLKAHVMPGEKISVKVELRNATDRRYLYHGWQIMKKDGTPAFAKKQEAGGSVESDIKDVGNHLFRGRNQRNSMSYVVTIFTEKHLYRVKY